MSAITKLKYAPIKYKPLGKVTEELVYKTGFKYWDVPESQIYIMLRSNRPNQRCCMAVVPKKIKRDGKKDVPSLYISNIISTPRRTGMGSKMLEFAKYISEKNGCNGFFHLDANSGYTPQNIPHIFYRKCGLNTGFSYINKRLDSFIQKKKNATHRDFKSVTMYYPPIIKPKNKLQTLLENLFT